MKLGFIGLGKMGSNMVERLLKDHQVAAYDKSTEQTQAVGKKGAEASSSLEDLVSKLTGRKIVWLMVPSGKIIDGIIDSLIPLMKKDDIIIDGGNSFYKDSLQRTKKVNEKGIHYIDCGVSGGIWGLKNGYCLMYGGENEVVNFVEPVFKTLAPENGYFHCGENGSGHFVKMVHNGIEYGMMESIAEGFEIMEKSNFNINLAGVSKVWQHGSVVKSWLLELSSLALSNDPDLSKIKGYVEDSGEGRWTVETAMELEVPAHTISASLFNRFRSREGDSFAMKVLAALRNEFGGHAVKNN